MTVTVQSGTILAQLDIYLSKKGYGLPVIGNPNAFYARAKNVSLVSE